MLQDMHDAKEQADRNMSRQRKSDIKGLVAPVPDREGNHEGSSTKGAIHSAADLALVAGQQDNQSQSTRASQVEDSGIVVTGRPSWLALVDSTSSAAEAGGGTTRHTRAWSVDAPTIVADCRRLRFGRGASQASAVSRVRQSWAVQGRSAVADDDHQAHGPTVSEQ
ncbi:hypothetical protein GCM10010253_23880 [Streptomyces badius]|uniref:Transposase n=1 Tax=Streptomyces badius TaxID=1941 RepID=A0ABQ2T1Q7_STRBA|nr:hypothetical protein GCM10010253_23880 [Streptomyces badius]